METYIHYYIYLTLTDVYDMKHPPEDKQIDNNVHEHVHG